MTPPDAAPRQAIVFLTHIESKGILAHFQRLRRETADLLDAFLCVHEPAPHNAADDPLPSDFRIAVDDGADLLPQRSDQMRQTQRQYNNGFTDLAFMPALLSTRLEAYDHLWFLEFDVDYSGNWGHFFAEVMTSSADLIGTTLLPRSHCPDWIHWSWFAAPPEVPSERHLRSFLPIARFSRKMLDCYRLSVSDRRWQGHTEALYPTLALYHGLTIADLGSGPFCPAAWQGLHYSNNPKHRGLAPGTLVARPMPTFAYFHENPSYFAAPNMLYHPVKAVDSRLT